MGNLKEGHLEISLKEGDKNLIVWKGKSDERDPSALIDPYFNSIIDSLKGKSLEIDFCSLEFMNSSTVPPIIQFIKNLETKGIKSTIYYNKDSKWQIASFKALQTIVSTMDNISVVGK